jgi:hypothetical protein
VDLVLGLSMTSADVRWVLVEGTTAEGATMCRDAAHFDTLDDVIAAVGDDRLHAIGVTWASEAEAAASALLDALAQRGLDNVITVSEQEATDSLATGIAVHGGYCDVAVCIVEPDDALVALVDADGVTTECVAPTVDEMLAQLDRADSHPEAIFVLGSADDIDSIADAFADLQGFQSAAVPVITAAEADLALARGAALASARAINALEARPARWRMPSRIGALSSVAAAAMVVFVVSLSAALGLGLMPDTDEAVTERAATIEQQPQPPITPSVAKAAPPPVPVAPPPPPAAPPAEQAPPPEAQTVVEAAAPVPDAIPMIEPPAAPPPEPAYVPPAPPVYVPPAPVPPVPQPRLRDRIIERIPIINRFHDP